MQRITPFLWFDHQAEEAARYYVGIFPNSSISAVHGFGDEEHGVDGVVTIVNFQIEGLEFMALNGGPLFKFNPAISMHVSCETQAEVDELWNKLCEGGEPSHCGWLVDKFGLSWQIIPTKLGQLMGDPNPAKVEAVRSAMMQMSKFDVQALQDAYDAAQEQEHP